MDRRSVLGASAVALVLFAVWWVAILRLDSSLALLLPYHRYELVALLYPEIYYPVLPGWILASAQPYGWGVWVAALGWMLLLSLAIGAGATKVASERGLRPASTAAAAIGGLFVLFTVVEAVGTLFA